MSRLSVLAARFPRILALGITGGLAVATAAYALHHVEPMLEASAHHLAPIPSSQKNQGTLIQKVAFRSPDILPLYGSSELTRPAMNRPSEFFANAPTGFQVCPVGVAGNTSLLVLMKLAALGEVVRGHKIGIMLSPGWFSRPCTPADHYAGNFSPLHAINTVENAALSKGLRRRIAARMLDYPDTLEAHPLLLMRARSLAGESPLSNSAKSVLNDLLRINAKALECEDAVQSVLLATKNKHATPWAAVPKEIAWEPLLQESAQYVVPSKRRVAEWTGERPSKVDAAKRREFESGDKGEWTDFVLLLDAIKELGIDALVISMPLAGARDDLEGVEPSTRHEFYYGRVAALCKERGIRVNTMESHDLDKDFLVDYVSHPTAVGWVHINHLLDDFWHNRLSPQS